jgi:hypothetical protein
MYERKKALAEHLGMSELEVNDIKDLCDNLLFGVEGEEWLVMNDEEANELVEEYIEQSLWAFNPTFLSRVTGVPKGAFASCGEECEGANGWIKQLITKTWGWDSFIDSAVNADGRGHFLSPYDGQEHVVETDEGTWYLYQVS